MRGYGGTERDERPGGVFDVGADQFCSYSETICAGMEAMRKIVHAFYDTAFNFGQFLRAHPEFRGDVTDCLIGNLFKDFDALFEAMQDFAAIPKPLEHGGPLVPEHA